MLGKRFAAALVGALALTMTGTVAYAAEPAPVVEQTLTVESASDAGILVEAPGVGVEQPAPYTVNIRKNVAVVEQGLQTRISGTSTGFSDGNWVNVWIRPAGTSTWIDGGGNWVRAGKFSIPAAYPDAGQWQTQLSLGAYPAEQYSQTVNTTVTKGRASTPYVVEAGNGAGGRFLKTSGRTNQNAGTTINLYVKSPGNRHNYMLAGQTQVKQDGTYLFDQPSAANSLAGGKGTYTIKVTVSGKKYTTIGHATYRNYN